MAHFDKLTLTGTDIWFCRKKWDTLIALKSLGLTFYLTKWWLKSFIKRKICILEKSDANKKFASKCIERSQCLKNVHLLLMLKLYLQRKNSTEETKNYLACIFKKCQIIKSLMMRGVTFEKTLFCVKSNVR